MARAFVIRPFGTKKDSKGTEFDFERAQKEVIGPALERASFAGSTTGEVIDSGNIREDMFSMIIEADLVVCDFTLLNANVFYELGIRHALRARHTVLIRDSASVDSPPFDLLTDRYLAYSMKTSADVKASCDQLHAVIEATVAATRETDSPVFKMLPELPEADVAAIQALPLDFVEEVERARTAQSKGWLRLLTKDLEGRRFERPGRVVVGRAQWDLEDYKGGRATWEAVRELEPTHIDANLALANIYERLSRLEPPGSPQAAELLTLSNQALQRALSNGAITTPQRVEAQALRGRNLKTVWRHGLDGAVSVEARRKAALNRELLESYRAYRAAFDGDLNHFWSGLASLQMASLLLDLSALQDEWNATFDSDKDAEGFQRALEADVAALKVLVPASVQGALRRMPKDDGGRIWAEVSRADALFLADDNAARVVKAYDCIPRGRPFVWNAAKGQLALFSALGFRKELADRVVQEVEARLAGAPAPPPEPKAADSPKPSTLVVVFAGHQVDADGAPERFPSSRAAKAKERIQAELAAIVDGRDVRHVRAYASGASGGDILFHEACQALGVTSVMCLPFAKDLYASVTFPAGSDDWRARFLDLRPTETLALASDQKLPRWLHGTAMDVWERGNRWVLEMALARGADETRCLVLWDGKEDGSHEGGTRHMVKLVRDAGSVYLKIIDPAELA